MTCPLEIIYLLTNLFAAFVNPRLKKEVPREKMFVTDHNLMLF